MCSFHPFSELSFDFAKQQKQIGRSALGTHPSDHKGPATDRPGPVSVHFSSRELHQNFNCHEASFLVEPSYDNATHVGALLSHGLQNLTTIVEIHLPREN